MDSSINTEVILTYPLKEIKFMNMSDATKKMIASYARSVLGAAVATYAATNDWKMALNALWAAVLPVAMRYLNPGDNAFGKNAG